MSNQQNDVAQAQQRYLQFVQLLPLTIEIAGLSHTDAGKYLTEDQMELRVQALRKAYKHARKLAKEAIQD